MKNQAPSAQNAFADPFCALADLYIQIISKSAGQLFPYIFLFIFLLLSTQKNVQAQASEAAITICTKDKTSGKPLAGADIVMQVDSRQPVGKTSGPDGCATIPVEAPAASDAVALPEAFRVDAPYPNPVVNQVSFPVSLQHTQQVISEIFDVTGRSVLPEQRLTLGPGKHRFEIDVSSLNSGLYMYRFEGEQGVATGKFIKVSSGSNAPVQVNAELAGAPSGAEPSSESFTISVDAVHQGYLAMQSDLDVTHGSNIVLEMEKLTPDGMMTKGFSSDLNPGYDCDTGEAATTSEYTIDLSSLSGSYAANSLSPHFQNTSGSIITNSYWTSASTKYLKGDDYTYVSTKSKYCSRDMEVDTWARNGIVYLRLTSDGHAIYFLHNGESTTGSIEIGYVRGLTEGAGYRYSDAGDFYPLYSNSNLVATIPGYSKDNTDEDLFTFGVEGFDMYARFNGEEFFRWTDYRHIAEGRVATQANAGYGFRNITVRNLAEAPLSSDYTNNTLDLRDFGLKSITATGTIESGSTKLSLTEPSNFNVGDFVIVETGGEPGKGLRGTHGAGGTWPSLAYADQQQMNADNSQQVDQYAWTADTGDVYTWNGTGWTKTSSYYIEKAIPRALAARILDVSSDGKVLTLDQEAVTSATDASVYFNNWYIIQRVLRPAKEDGPMNWPPGYSEADQYIDLSAITPDGLTIYIPEGDYAFGKHLEIREHAGWHFKGAGKDKTRLFSPDGTPSAEIRLAFAPKSTISDLHLMGNAGEHGFMLSGNQQFFSDTEVTQGEAYPSGVLMGQDSHGSVARDLNITDVFQKAVGASFCNDCWAYSIENTMTEPLSTYVQWMYQWADATGGGCVDCSVTSPYLVPGFEAFKSENVHFIRPKSVNATMAMNSAGNFLIEDADITITSMSQHPNKSFSKENPIVNINSNIAQDHPYLEMGGIIRNINIMHEGYVNDDNDLLRGIVVNVNNPNVVIEGGYVQGPNWSSPSSLPGVNGVTSTGANTVVEGMTVNGTINEDKYPGANIAVLTSGVIRNCVAEMVKVLGTATIENCVQSGGGVPTADLTASTTSVYAGDSVTLSWSSTGADSCEGTPFFTGGSTSGDTEVTVLEASTYTLTCTNSTGSVTDNLAIEILPGVDLPTAELTASATSVIAGDAVTLTWTSTEAASCEGTNFSTLGSTSGTIEIVILDTKTYTLTCSNSAGSTNDDVTIQVNANDNQLPVADAGEDVVITDTNGDGSESVFVDGSTSYDPDGSLVSYDWFEGADLIASGPSAIYAFSLGVHEVTLIVTDDKGAMASDEVIITVDPVSTVELTSSVYKVRGDVMVDLTWSGMGANSVDIYRDGLIIGSGSNDGFYSDNLGKGAGESYVYQVCSTDGAECSKELLVEIGSGKGKKNT